MIKLLVGEISPQEGDVWKHPNARIAYVAQHAFHHIESHLNKTPNEYIRWRFANGGEDKESLVKVTLQFTEEELALQKKPFEITIVDETSGKISKVKKVVSELVGGRKQNKSKEYEYEVKYSGSTVDSGEYLPAKTLKKMGRSDLIGNGKMHLVPPRQPPKRHARVSGPTRGFATQHTGMDSAGRAARQNKRRR